MNQENQRFCRLPLTLGFIVLALAVIGLVGVRLTRSGRTVFGAEKIPLRIAGQPAAINLGEFKNGFASAIDPALPAVVNISTTETVKQQSNIPSLFNDPFFRQFFGGSTFSRSKLRLSGRMADQEIALADFWTWQAAPVSCGRDRGRRFRAIRPSPGARPRRRGCERTRTPPGAPKARGIGRWRGGGW